MQSFHSINGLLANTRAVGVRAKVEFARFYHQVAANVAQFWAVNLSNQHVRFFSTLPYKAWSVIFPKKRQLVYMCFVKNVVTDSPDY